MVLRQTPLVAAVFVVSVVWPLRSVPAISQDRATPNPLALVGGTVYVDPTTEPIRDAVVLIQDGKIGSIGSRVSTAIPSNARRVDCAGLTIPAGFWNSNVHFLHRKWTESADIPALALTRQLQTMLTRYGFTSVFDTWSAWDNTRQIRERIERGEVEGPRIRSTGEAMFGQGVTATAASWASLGFIDLDRFQTARVASASDASDASKRLLDRGVDALKFYAATPGRNSVVVPEPAIEAGVREAHSRGRPVFSHPSNGAGLLASVRAGVDVIAHTTPESGPWDATTISAMKQAGVALIPTLKLWNYEFRHERASLADRFVNTAVGQLKAWRGVGGTVLFGTDVGYMSDYDPTEEYVLISQTGKTLSGLFPSLTTAPGKRFGLSQKIRRLFPGLASDVACLCHDPAQGGCSHGTGLYKKS